jgi:hypothetical protein
VYMNKETERSRGHVQVLRVPCDMLSLTPIDA